MVQCGVTTGFQLQRRGMIDRVKEFLLGNDAGLVDIGDRMALDRRILIHELVESIVT